LRRLCRRELGRSPMHHVIFLRMRHAAKLLAATDDKIETIAGEVGYANPFVFSTTFKKWVGWRPSDYRARGR
jgi:AraC-like DNA-binding protein